MANKTRPCHRCGCEIPAERLEALPDTIVCIECSKAIGGEYVVTAARPRCSPSLLARIQLAENSLRGGQSLPASREAGIGRNLKQRFDDLLPGGAIVERHAHVQLQSQRPAQGRKGGDRHQALGRPIELRPAPDLAGQELDDVFLEIRTNFPPTLAGTFRALGAEHLLQELLPSFL